MSPPLYPFFIWLFHIFGTKQYIALRWGQSILTFWSLLYAADWMHKNLSIPRFINITIMALMIGFMSFHGQTLTRVFSEGLSFPIFIVTFFYLVEAFQSPDLKKIALVSLGSSLLILTRHQFYYFYVMLAFSVIWNYWRRGLFRLMIKNLGLITLFIIMTGILSQQYYHWVSKSSGQSWSAAQWQFTGWRVLVQPMYLAHSTDDVYFSDPEEKKLFDKILNHLEKDQYTRKTAPPLKDNDNILAAEYHYMSILGKFQDSIRRGIEQSQPIDKSPEQVDKMLFHMTKTLVAHSIKENLVFYLLRVTFYSGAPLWVFLSLMIIFLTMIYRIILDKSWCPTIEQAFVMMALIFIVLNSAFVAIVEVQMPRYFYYSIFLYFCLFGLLSTWFINKIDSQ